MRNKIQQIRVMKNRIFKWAIKYMWNLTIIAGRVGIYPWKLTNLFDPITHPPVHEHLFGWIWIYFFRFFRFWAGNGLPFFCRVTTRPAQRIKIKILTLILQTLPNFISLFSLIFSAASLSLSPLLPLSCLPHSHATTPPSLPHGVTPSISHLTTHSVDLSPHTRPHRPVPRFPHGLTPLDPWLSSRPHSLKSMPPFRSGLWFWFCF